MGAFICLTPMRNGQKIGLFAEASGNVKLRQILPRKSTVFMPYGHEPGQNLETSPTIFENTIGLIQEPCPRPLNRKRRTFPYLQKEKYLSESRVVNGLGAGPIR